MSQEGSAIGNRLGISKGWLADFGEYKYRENLNKSIFLREWMTRMIKRFSIWLVAMKIIKQKNTFDIHLLCIYFPNKIPLVHTVFFILRHKPHWYWVPTVTGFFDAAYFPKSRSRMGAPASSIISKFWKMRKKPIWTYRKVFLRLLESFLEDYLSETLRCSINLKLYNLIDYYHVFGGSTMNGYISEIIKSFPGVQYSLNRKNLKTSLFYLCLGVCRKNAMLIARVIAYESRRSKRWSVVIGFLFRIIAEVFYYIPGPESKKLPKEYSRATCLRVKISGKKEGEMRALRHNYYFSNLQAKMIPLQTLDIDVNYSLAEARTVAGILGVKVWIY